MRQRFDSGDFVQLVWASFFKARGGFDRFSSPNELAAFLVGMARNKVAAEARRCLIRPTSNMNRERYLDDSNDDIAQSLQSSEAEPVDVAIAKEQYERFLEGQPDHYRQIVELRLAGHTQRDVASQVGLAECTVHRFLNKLCQQIGD
jgi:RNA polymerase sigma factor (sigma-70 family)